MMNMCVYSRGSLRFERLPADTALQRYTFLVMLVVELMQLGIVDHMDDIV